MEAAGVVFRPVPNISGAGVDFPQSNSSCSSKPSISGVGGARRLFSRKKFSGCLSSGYFDNSHLHYYSSRAAAETAATTRTSAIKCGAAEKVVKEEKKMVKTKLKLVKNLSRNLSAFSQMGFGLNPDQNLVDDVKQKMISEAAELLIAQLQQLKAEEKELKRNRKGQKAKLKAEKMQERQRLGLEMDSSSSSESSSSSGECGEVVDMSCLKMGTEAESLAQPVVDAASTLTLLSTIQQDVDLSGTQPAAVPTFPSSSVVNGRNFEEKCCNGINSCTSNNIACVDINTNSGSIVSSGELGKKIEVCMGGKCKKSGGASLLEEFQRAVGIEGAVIGCKCMGNCRDGPNVRVLNAAANAAGGVDDSIRTPTNPLCIGVGLEDVGLIVDNYFGKNQNNFGFATS